eukprot:PhM_4_TR9252/c0_g1_i1/m.76925
MLCTPPCLLSPPSASASVSATTQCMAVLRGMYPIYDQYRTAVAVLLATKVVAWNVNKRLPGVRTFLVTRFPRLCCHLDVALHRTPYQISACALRWASRTLCSVALAGLVSLVATPSSGLPALILRLNYTEYTRMVHLMAPVPSTTFVSEDYGALELTRSLPTLMLLQVPDLVSRALCFYVGTLVEDNRAQARTIDARKRKLEIRTHFVTQALNTVILHSMTLALHRLLPESVATSHGKMMALHLGFMCVVLRARRPVSYITAAVAHAYFGRVRGVDATLSAAYAFVVAFASREWQRVVPDATFADLFGGFSERHMCHLSWKLLLHSSGITFAVPGTQRSTHRYLMQVSYYNNIVKNVGHIGRRIILGGGDANKSAATVNNNTNNNSDDDGDEGEEEEDRCIVCQVEMSRGEVIRVLPCGHQYHEHCITTWLRQKRSCPLCKAAYR